MSGHNYHGLDKVTVQDAIDSLAHELTGQYLDELEHDERGAYWTRDKWLSGHDLGQALIDAYVKGKEGRP